jgi:hypothetical protein
MKAVCPCHKTTFKRPSLSKKPEPAVKMSRTKWLEYKTSLAETEALLGSVTFSCYDRVPEDTIYIARDYNDRVILPRGFEFTYGPETGRRCAKALANNIKNTLNPSRHQPFWIVAMPTINSGSNRMAMSIFGRQRDTVEYITGALGSSKVKADGGPYGLRIIVLVGRVPESWMGRTLSGYVGNSCSRLVL